MPNLASIPTQHQEVKAGVGQDQEVATQGGVGAGSLRKKLPRGSSGGALVWSVDMGAFGTNGVQVRGSAFDFPAAGHTKTGKAAQGWIPT